ncbi:hypothetical protein EST38_g3749 [Candolleomyces aberdarensis]|uniref:RING-type domain-containing protein n=1 Tax=Candolleomyces aberdarensis TaxID=2316362 RepID=A0A4Q2DTD2_9AGAR|nr:hypothetical protein EST38_g3749 [Candolleomyces aberdarensis]
MDYNDFAEHLRELNNQPLNTPDSDQAAFDSDMPPLEAIPSREYTPLSPLTASVDVEMADYNMAVHSDSESDRDALEVEMQAVVAGDDIEDPPLPEIETAVPASRPNNRRARVEDDEDEERDRRHPSHRLTNPIASSSTRPSTSRLSSTFRSSFRSTRDPPAGVPSDSSAPSDTSSTSSSGRPQSMPSASSTTQRPRQPQPGPGGRLPPFMTGGIAISIDIGDFPFGPGPGFGAGVGAGAGAGARNPAGTDAPGNDQPFNPPEGGPPRMPEGMGLPPSFAELFSNPMFLSEMLGIEPDIEDPERANRLIEGLEEVPVGLVKRLERVGGMAGASGDELTGGDSGCAVCWEKLLEVDDENSTTESDSRSKQKEREKEEGEEEEKKPHPKIVSLPCAHVFHAECLRPWFSRPKQTTCPTCRFNIDPENLTYVPYRQRRRAQRNAASSSTSSNSTTSSTTEDNATATNEASTSTAPAQPSSNEPSATPAQPQEEAARGRTDSSSAPPPRRAGSEPPSNRTSRPSGFGHDMIQSFSIPGGHVVVVSQPIGILTDAQGRPIGEFIVRPTHRVLRPPVAERSAPNAAQQANPGDARSQAQTQPTAPPAGPAPADTSTTTTQTPASTSAPAPEQRPVFGPPPPPGTGIRGLPVPGLPEGVIAFDIHFGMAPPGFLFGEGSRRTPQQGQGQQQHPESQPDFQPQQTQAPEDPSQPQPQPQRAQAPPLRIPGMFGPGAFAGVNFGPRQGGGDLGFNVTDLLRGIFGPPPGNQQRAANAPQQPSQQPAQPPAAFQEPQPAVNPTPATVPTEPPAEATPGSDPTPPSADNDPSTPPPPGPGADGEGNERERESDAAFFRFLANSLANPSAFLRLLLAAGLMGAGGPGLGFRHGSPEPRSEAAKKDWAPPPAPGPTLRQRVERREQEAGLRCSDVSCGIGPSDDEPFVSAEQRATKQFAIHLVGDVRTPVCVHAFHSACLVSAERVASRGAEASIVGDDVEVSCPVCRGVGCVSKVDWDEGVQGLQ